MRFLMLVAAIIGMIAFWVWFLFFKEAGDIKGALLIEGYAKAEIINACNQAAAAAGNVERFKKEDVRVQKLNDMNISSGVKTMVSILDVTHGALHCKWDGENAAQIYP